ncbi:hypothetical protein RBB50_007453 [Rhinocladiella similis]
MTSREVFKIPESVLETALVKKVLAPQHHSRKRKREDDNEEALSVNSVVGRYNTIFGRRDVPETQTRTYPQAKIETIDHDLLLQIFNYLDVPSRVCLALTNKFFGTFCMTPEISGPMPLSNSTQLEYVPDPTALIGYSNDEYNTYCSRRRMTLLLLRSWMPSDLQLCWICMKYTPLTRTKANAAYFKPWSKNATGTMIITMINESADANPDTNLRVELHCHNTCLPRITKSQPMPFDLVCRHLPGGHAVHYNFGIDLREVVYLGSEVFEWGHVLPHVKNTMKQLHISFEKALRQNVGSPVGLWRK